MNNLNLFMHAPKELVTDAFFTWLLYFLNEPKYQNERNTLFTDLFLEPGDNGKNIDKIEIDNQNKKESGRSDLILSFNLGHEPENILFENKTWSTTTEKQLMGYKNDNPGFYRYVYLKLAYINYHERKITNKKGCDYKIIDVHKISAALAKIENIHPFVEQYLEFINTRFKNFIDENLVLENINRNNKLLKYSQVQQFVMDHIYKRLDDKLDYLLYKTGRNTGGGHWTQLDICKKRNVYGDKSEVIFWRIDIRAGKYYIRLNQYSKIDAGFKSEKNERLKMLRDLTASLLKKYDKLKPGKHINKGTYEQEIMILFLDNNELNNLLRIIPRFSMDFVETYKKT